jgi:LacI family transcriptional regulator
VSRKPTRDDVAKLAGVSVATVSYVINDSPQQISQETRERVLAAIDQLGYRPHLIARSLKTGQTFTIGVIVPTIASAGMAMMANVVQESLLERDYFTIITSTREKQSLEEKMIDLMVSQSVDGFIICPVGVRTYDELHALASSDVPVVFMDRRIPDFPADFVMTDNVQATHDAVQYLLGEGCRDILCISFSSSASSALDRMAGCQKGIDASRIKDAALRTLVVEDPTGALAEQSFASFLDVYGLPDGLVCTTEEIGVSVLKALRRQKIDYPYKNLVVFDADWGAMLAPPVPVILQNFTQIGRTAVDLLIERINGTDTPPRTILVEADLIV